MEISLVGTGYVGLVTGACLADISKAQKALGYKTKVKIEEGLSKEVEWMKNSVDWQ